MTPKALLHGASHRLSDSLNPNSTENFKYVWLETLGTRVEFHKSQPATSLPPSGTGRKGFDNLSTVGTESSYIEHEV